MEYGGYMGYENEKRDINTRYVHYYINVSIRDKNPLNLLVRGHEQMHLLQPEILNARTLLEEKLSQLNWKESPYVSLKNT